MKEIEQKLTEIVNNIEILFDTGFRDSAISALLILGTSIVNMLFMSSYGKILFIVCAIITTIFAIGTIYFIISIILTIIKGGLAINQLKYANDLPALENAKKQLSSMLDTLETKLSRHSIMLYTIIAWGLINSIYILLYSLVHIAK